MCEFCKSKSKAIISDLKVYKDRTVTATSEITNGNTLRFFCNLAKRTFCWSHSVRSRNKNILLPHVWQRVDVAVNLAEAKEKYYPTYKYALVNIKSKKPHSLYVDRKNSRRRKMRSVEMLWCCTNCC